MCSGILDTHKELFRSHSIQEPRPGQGLQHQGITLSQKKTDPSFLASPGELWESDKGVKPKSGV